MGGIHKIRLPHESRGCHDLAMTVPQSPVTEVPVLIVGGSLVGLSTAMLLAWHGIESLAVERHASTAINPRAGHFNLRTLEILRSAGLEGTVRRRSEQQYVPDGGISNVESLAGREIMSFFTNLNAGVAEFSPTVRTFIDQDALEPILRARAEELGARLRYRTECTALDSDDDGVTATLADLDAGSTSQVRARYVVAADGNRSPVRRRLGIGMRGHGVMSDSITIYFRADEDLSPLLAGRNQGVLYVTNPVLRGFFRLDRSGNAGFLVVNLIGDIARPEIVAAYPDAPWANVAAGITEAKALELLRAAIGVPGMPVTIKDIATWRATADLADRYGDGRIFLAGDAAHVVPPNGGFGGNTGVHDAHNLAWKLAAVLNGTAGPGLLDSYEAERRPVGDFTVEQSYSRYVTRVAPYLGTDGVQPVLDDLYLELGYRYASAAILTEPGDDATPVHPREGGGRPGTRAPHAWVNRDGQPVSTLDLFGRNFTLLVAGGADGGAWREQVRIARARLGVTVDVCQEGADVTGEFATAYGITPGGAALIRPDGYIAWRSAAPTTANDALTSVLRAILDRPA
jgi:2-polyprenyl-6-methoxyphenol hydroxylase-like FAD-dependent oxidoreductase